MTKARNSDADVAIVGAGPVGILLALLLGKSGRQVTLIERWPTTYDRPRAVTMDHEVARILATLGIDCNNDDAIEYHEELYYWKNANLEDLQLVDWKSVSSSGWRVTYWFNQPELEERLFKLVEKMPTVKILRGWEAKALSQDNECATLDIEETAGIAGRNGAKQQVRGQYVVGADGANSFVRQQLEITVIDKGYFYDWLILDMIPHEGYTMSPAQWQLCDPKRPTTIVPGGPGRRRWEFMVLPGESSEEIAKEANAWKLLEPWGLTPDNAQLERSAVYQFQARWAETWRKDRCLIAGDAAHLMPPFAGEGMCAGLRDAVSLGWRLDALLDGRVGDGILDSYVSERIHHAKHYIDFSQELGKIICIADPEEAETRDREMMDALAARNYEPIHGDNCKLGKGVWNVASPTAGELSTQGNVEVEGVQDLFDQIVGQGWFVIAVNAEIDGILSASQHSVFERFNGRFVQVGTRGSICDAIDVDGTYADWMSEIDANYVIIRPDFYIAASAKTKEELSERFDDVMSKLCLVDTA